MRRRWRRRRLEAVRPNWRWKQEERWEGEWGWTARFWPDAWDAVMFAVLREEELRGRAYRQAHCDHEWQYDRDGCVRCGLTLEEWCARRTATALSVVECAERVSARGLAVHEAFEDAALRPPPIRCAECGYAYSFPPSAGVLCPRCGSGGRIYPGITRS